MTGCLSLERDRFACIADRDASPSRCWPVAVGCCRAATILLSSTLDAGPRLPVSGLGAAELTGSRRRARPLLPRLSATTGSASNASRCPARWDPATGRATRWQDRRRPLPGDRATSPPDDFIPTVIGSLRHVNDGNASRSTRTSSAVAGNVTLTTEHSPVRNHREAYDRQTSRTEARPSRDQQLEPTRHPGGINGDPAIDRQRRHVLGLLGPLGLTLSAQLGDGAFDISRPGTAIIAGLSAGPEVVGSTRSTSNGTATAVGPIGSGAHASGG